MKFLTTATFALMMTLSFIHTDDAEAGRAGKRMQRQQKRVQNGKQNGSITRRESRSLKRDQKRTRTMRKEIRSDGEVTKQERRMMEKRQDKNSKHIYNAKHNDRNQGDWRDKAAEGRMGKNGGDHKIKNLDGNLDNAMVKNGKGEAWRDEKLAKRKERREENMEGLESKEKWKKKRKHHRGEGHDKVDRDVSSDIQPQEPAPIAPREDD